MLASPQVPSDTWPFSYTLAQKGNLSARSRSRQPPFSRAKSCWPASLQEAGPVTLTLLLGKGRPCAPPSRRRFRTRGDRKLYRACKRMPLLSSVLGFSVRPANLSHVIFRWHNPPCCCHALAVAQTGRLQNKTPVL